MNLKSNSLVKMLEALSLPENINKNITRILGLDSMIELMNLQNQRQFLKNLVHQLEMNLFLDHLLKCLALETITKIIKLLERLDQSLLLAQDLKERIQLKALDLELMKESLVLLDLGWLKLDLEVLKDN